jgi:tetratricopeptide (TPR) repeat protein
MIRAAAIAVALAAFAPRAWASADDAAGDRPGRVLFEQAEAKFNVGRFEEALVDYQAAYDAEPLPAFLFNIGQCYRNLGNYERAQFFFRRYTALDPRSANRPAAERLIAEMDKLAAERASSAESNQPPPEISTLPAPAAGAHPATTERAGFMAQPGPAAASPAPVYRRTWFWVAVSAIVVAGGVAAAFALSQNDPRSSLHPIDAR